MDTASAIAQTGSAMQAARIQGLLATTLAAKSLDQARMEGQMAVGLIEASAVPPPGTGQIVNVTA